ncbi:MAG: Tetratricopeptide repeat protein [Verrucomicrobia bacterium ADurb.Bin122]|nr:MAG: Tetratricopeptide repeat protein [Verrucomicrobia bacterium ADurb.Bin122]
MNATPLPRVRPIPLGRLLVALLLLLPLTAVAAESAAPEGAVYELPENPDELLRVDDEMRAFFAPRIPHTSSVERRIDAIVEAVLGDDGLRFRYEPNGLYDVRETFRRRAGNCVSYSMLIVAVAREFRIPAEFNEVDVRPRWNRAGKLVLRTGHINVRVPEPGGDFEIDLKMMANFRASGGMARAVNDARAFSSMYTSAGVFRLVVGDPAGALRLLERAVRTDPRNATAWCNLGNAQWVVGRLGDARRSFERAVAVDPASLAGLNGLAQVHRRTGDLKTAERLDRQVKRYRDRNPYYLYWTARNEAAAGQLEEARRHLRRAIRLKDDEPEFHEFMSEIRSRMAAAPAPEARSGGTALAPRENLLAVR